jgi:ATP-binding cassette subfamily F protein 3
MVSHDRDFLDSTVDHILHIEAGSVKLYRGNYAAFEKRRAEHLSHEQAQYVRQKRQIEHMESFISRFRYKATKARQAQSRLKALERMTRIIPAHVDSVFRFSFHPPEKLPATLVTLENSAVGYGNTRVLDKVNLRLSPGDRIGLLGSNGAGKSTLVKLLAGELDLISGDRIEGGDVEIGYFAQWQLDQLEPGMSPVQHLLKIDPTGGEQKLRDYLGGFGFSNEQALAPVEHFSGGEKSRLVLALVIYRRPNLLLLDEPTNHLDIEMRQALASALQEFTGAMVLVSHDRHLLRVSCDELLLVDNGNVGQYDQSLDEYADWLGRRKQLQNAAGEHVVNPNPAATVDRRQKRQIEAEMRQRLQPFTRVIKRAESEMEQLHKERNDLESVLSNNSLYGETQKARLKEMLLKKAEIDRSLEKVEAEWLAASEKSEALRKPG